MEVLFHMRIYIYTHAYTHTNCIYICMHIDIYIDTYIYIYIYAYQVAPGRVGAEVLIILSAPLGRAADSSV
jgi:hypothetical protein